MEILKDLSQNESYLQKGYSPHTVKRYREKIKARIWQKIWGKDRQREGKKITEGGELSTNL